MVCLVGDVLAPRCWLVASDALIKGWSSILMLWIALTYAVNTRCMRVPGFASPAFRPPGPGHGWSHARARADRGGLL
jgi:hypothetical protein